MRKNSLASKGLSMSQAQSISNLCNQRSRDISFKLRDINNVEKVLKIGEETYVETPGKKMPENVVDLLADKSRLHAAQAFLMENIKAKEEMLTSIKHRQMDFDIEKESFLKVNKSTFKKRKSNVLFFSLIYS